MKPEDWIAFAEQEPRIGSRVLIMCNDTIVPVFCVQYGLSKCSDWTHWMPFVGPKERDACQKWWDDWEARPETPSRDAKKSAFAAWTEATRQAKEGVRRVTERNHLSS